MDKLNLTDDQKKQLADLEADTKAKLEKILTADQLKAMQDARPPRRGGQGGQGGAPGGKDTAAGDAAGNGGPPAGGPPAGGPPAGGGQGGRPKR